MWRWQLHHEDLNSGFSVKLPDGKIKLVSYDQSVRIWNPVDGALIRQPERVPTTDYREFYIDSIHWYSHGKFVEGEYVGSGKRFRLNLPEDRMEFAAMIAGQENEVYYMSRRHGAGRITTGGVGFESVTDQDITSINPQGKDLFLGGKNGVFQLSDQEGKKLRKILDVPNVWMMGVDDNGHFMVNQFLSPSTSATTFITKDKSFEESTTFYDQIVLLQDGRLAVDHRVKLNSSLPVHYVGDLLTEITGELFTDSRVRYFMQSANADLWLVTMYDGIYQVDARNRILKFPEFNSERKPLVNAHSPHYLYETSDHCIYLASSQGLHKYDPEMQSWSNFQLPAKSENTRVMAMTEDGNGLLWIMSRRTLFVHNPESGETTYYRVPPEFRIGNHQPKDLVLHTDGFVYYLGNKPGVIRFDPEEMLKQSAPEPILLTDLYIDRQRVSPGDGFGALEKSVMHQSQFEVPFLHHNVGFKFVSTNGRAVDANYFYRLQGYDETWVDAGTERTIHYTNLDPGDYIFEVKAQASGGNWTDEVSQISFSIIPPWYRTHLAYISYFGLLLLIGYGFYRYRVAQILRYQELRTKISSDLHDDVGTILSAVAMQSEVLGLDAPQEKVERFEKLSYLSREAMGRMRDTVWAIDARKDNMESLIDRMQDYLADLFDERTNWRVDFQHETNPSKKIAPDIRQNVYLIFKEVVNNAAKHSNGDTLVVQLKQTPQMISISVADNGEVDHSQIKTSGTGLSNLKMRANRIGGELIIDWEKGVDVRLVVYL